jgi:hypothetical protein
MKYVLSLSGGAASAVAADRAIARYGRENVLLWMANTSFEDADLWRFVEDCMQRWTGILFTGCDGRTPLEIAEWKQIIPSSHIAPCSYALKIKPFRDWLAQQEKPLTVLLELGWNEQQRMAAPRKHYEAIEGVSVDYPLMWQPLEFRPYQEVVQAWGIEPPRMYAMGFSHNNCGGRCVKQGIREWQRLAVHFPERFAEMRDWEQAQRAKGGARANYAMLTDRRGGIKKPLTLLELEQRELPTDDDQPSQDDTFSCMCSAE